MIDAAGVDDVGDNAGDDAGDDDNGLNLLPASPQAAELFQPSIQPQIAPPAKSFCASNLFSCKRFDISLLLSVCHRHMEISMYLCGDFQAWNLSQQSVQRVTKPRFEGGCHQFHNRDSSSFISRLFKYFQEVFAFFQLQPPL